MNFKLLLTIPLLLTVNISLTACGSNVLEVVAPPVASSSSEALPGNEEALTGVSDETSESVDAGAALLETQLALSVGDFFAIPVNLTEGQSASVTFSGGSVSPVSGLMTASVQSFAGYSFNGTQPMYQVTGTGDISLTTYVVDADGTKTTVGDFTITVE